MKIRLDYVTNSSSSSFIVQMNIETKNNSVLLEPFYEEAMECEDCFSSNWKGSLKDVLNFKDKDELFDYISSKFSNDSYYDYEDGKEPIVDVDKSQYDKVIKDVNDIERIVVRRDYNAWGECADIIADNDFNLIGFAKKYKNAKDSEKEVILDEAFMYVSNPIKGLCGEDFGIGVDEFFYEISGKDALIKVLERLTTGYGPGDVSGYEEVVYDLKGKKVHSKAVFYLS